MLIWTEVRSQMTNHLVHRIAIERQIGVIVADRIQTHLDVVFGNFARGVLLRQRLDGTLFRFDLCSEE